MLQLVIIFCYLLSGTRATEANVTEEPEALVFPAGTEDDLEGRQMARKIIKEKYAEASSKLQMIKDENYEHFEKVVGTVVKVVYNDDKELGFDKLLTFTKNFTNKQGRLILIKTLLEEMTKNDDLPLIACVKIAFLLRDKVIEGDSSEITKEARQLLGDLEKESVERISKLIGKILKLLKASSPISLTDKETFQQVANLLYLYNNTLLEEAMTSVVDELYGQVGPWIIQDVLSSGLNGDLHQVIIGCKVLFTRMRKQNGKGKYNRIEINETANWRGGEKKGDVTEEEAKYLEIYLASLRRMMKGLVSVFYNKTADQARFEIITNFTMDHVERTASLLLLKHMFRAMRNDSTYSDKYLMLVSALRKEVRYWDSKKEDTEHPVTDLEDSLIRCTKDLLSSVAEYLQRNESVPFQYQYNGRAIVDLTFAYSEHLLSRAIQETLEVVYTNVGPFASMRLVTSFNIFAEVMIGFKALFDFMKRNNDMNKHVEILTLAHTLQSIANNPLYLQIPLRYRQDLSDVDNLSDMRKALPLSVRNVVFSPKVCIKNHAVKKYLTTSGNETFDKYRRAVTFFHPGIKEKRDFRVWVIERLSPFTTKYFIKSEALGEYLFVSVLDYDQDRRRLFTWTSGKRIQSSLFYIEPYFDSITLRSVDREEYVTVGDVPGQGPTLFTRKNVKNCEYDERYLWTVEAC